ncbi:unnamed protein product [Pedinophyceae sp. YPF-701]|nr:unnamed protein product [Pedinophyceae sp. YPF-701]
MSGAQAANGDHAPAFRRSHDLQAKHRPAGSEASSQNASFPTISVVRNGGNMSPSQQELAKRRFARNVDSGSDAGRSSLRSRKLRPGSVTGDDESVLQHAARARSVRSETGSLFFVDQDHVAAQAPAVEGAAFVIDDAYSEMINAWWPWRLFPRRAVTGALRLAQTRSWMVTLAVVAAVNVFGGELALWAFGSVRAYQAITATCTALHVIDMVCSSSTPVNIFRTRSTYLRKTSILATVAFVGCLASVGVAVLSAWGWAGLEYAGSGRGFLTVATHASAAVNVAHRLSLLKAMSAVSIFTRHRMARMAAELHVSRAGNGSPYPAGDQAASDDSAPPPPAVQIPTKIQEIVKFRVCLLLMAALLFLTPMPALVPHAAASLPGALAAAVRGARGDVAAHLTLAAEVLAPTLPVRVPEVAVGVGDRQWVLRAGGGVEESPAGSWAALRAQDGDIVVVDGDGGVQTRMEFGAYWGTYALQLGLAKALCLGALLVVVVGTSNALEANFMRPFVSLFGALFGALSALGQENELLQELDANNVLSLEGVDKTLSFEDAIEQVVRMSMVVLGSKMLSDNRGAAKRYKDLESVDKLTADWIATQYMADGLDDVSAPSMDDDAIEPRRSFAPSLQDHSGAGARCVSTQDATVAHDEVEVVSWSELGYPSPLKIEWAAHILTIPEENLLIQSALEMMDTTGAFDGQISRRKTALLLSKLRGEYIDNPYHNFRHAIDVMHTCHHLLLLMNPRLRPCPLEQYAVLLAAIAHDVGHPGVNNAFLVETKNPIALRYNDKAVLENLHAATLFELAADSDSDILAGLSQKDYRRIRALLVESILLTDMTQHFQIISDLDQMATTKAEEIAAMTHALSKGAACATDAGRRAVQAGASMDEKDRKYVQNIVLHAADIGSMLKPGTLPWSDCVLVEFFAQGEREASMGMPVSPMMDPALVDPADSQLKFLEFIVFPLMEAIVRIFPEVHALLPQLQVSYQAWYDRYIESVAKKEASMRANGAAGQAVADQQQKIKDVQIRASNFNSRAAASQTQAKEHLAKHGFKVARPSVLRE